MSAANPSTHFTAAIGRRFDNIHILDGTVKVKGIDLEFPQVTRRPTGAPMPMFSPLARDHPWDIGELAFSTYLMSYDLGKPQVALPIFPSRFFAHTGAWVSRQSDISAPTDLIGQRVACNSFGTNYSVWLRGILSHQYDVPVERMTWVESVDEHLLEFHPPKRFTVERIPGETDALDVLFDGKADAVSLTGSALRADPERLRPLFEAPYPEIAAYVEATGVFPINTLITVRRDAVERNPDLPALVLDAFRQAKGLYDAEVVRGEQDMHSGLSLKRLNEEMGLSLPEYGFGANRDAIRLMIAYCYEQGIITNLLEPEDVFLLAES